MTWVVLVGVLALLTLLFMRARSKPAPPAKPPALATAPNRRFQDLRSREGSICIYEEGATILKVRLQQVQEAGAGVLFALQTLRAEGLSDFKDELIHLEIAWNGLDLSPNVVHARHSHWKLFFDRVLVARILELGQSGTDTKAIKRALLEHQMK